MNRGKDRGGKRLVERTESGERKEWGRKQVGGKLRTRIEETWGRGETGSYKTVWRGGA